MNPNWRKATFTMTDDEFREQMKQWDVMDSRTKIAPWLLTLIVGKSRPKYRWQVRLSNHWPTREIPLKERASYKRNQELQKFIDNVILEEIDRKITNRDTL